MSRKKTTQAEPATDIGDGTIPAPATRRRRTKEEMAALRAPKDPLVVIAEARSAALHELAQLRSERDRIDARIEALDAAVNGNQPAT
jgi:hypothetical protein